MKKILIVFLSFVNKGVIVSEYIFNEIIILKFEFTCNRRYVNGIKYFKYIFVKKNY